MGDCSRWEFNEVMVEVDLVDTSAYGDDGVHSREAAGTRREKKRTFATLALRREEKQSFRKKRVIKGK